jgi:small ligand-binding sensory domain FIST
VGAWLLGVREDGLPDHYGGIVTRVVFGFDEQSGAVQLMAPIAPGTRVQLCHRARGRVRDGAIEMAKRLRAALDGRPSLFALGFECGGRTGPFLGEEETRAECRDVLAELGDVPWLGMYAWGELAPVGGRLLLHQLTFPVLLFHA